MSADQNKELMQRIFTGFSQGDSSLFVESMDDDFHWNIIGNTKWSRTCFD